MLLDIPAGIPKKAICWIYENIIPALLLTSYEHPMNEVNALFHIFTLAPKAI